MPPSFDKECFYAFLKKITRFNSVWDLYFATNTLCIPHHHSCSLQGPCRMVVVVKRGCTFLMGRKPAQCLSLSLSPLLQQPRSHWFWLALQWSLCETQECSLNEKRPHLRFQQTACMQAREGGYEIIVCMEHCIMWLRRKSLLIFKAALERDRSHSILERHISS